MLSEYPPLEEEFNRRQMRGEPCNDLVKAMVAILIGSWSKKRELAKEVKS